MNYKLYVLNELEQQNLYYDPLSLPYSKLVDERDLTDKELEAVLKRIGVSNFVVEQKLSHIKTYCNCL